MKKFLIIFGLLFHLQLFASHISGGYINYTCLGNNQYHVEVIVIVECGNANLDAYRPFGIHSTSLNYHNESFQLPFERFENIVLCGGNSNTCNGGILAGFRKGIFSGNITLPGQASDWELFTNVADRNNSIINDGPAYFSAGINNANGICVSSIKFTDNHAAQVCLNKPMDFHAKFTVPSSITTVTSTLISPLTVGGGSPQGYPGAAVSYDTPYSYVNPLNTAGNFQYNGTDHIATITSNTTNFSAYAARFEFKDASGNYLGYTMRETQIISSNTCGNLQPSVNVPPSNLMFEVTPFAGQKCMTLTFTDPEGNLLSFEDVESEQGVSVTNLQTGPSSAMNLEVCHSYSEVNCQDIVFPVTFRYKDSSCLSTIYRTATFYVKILRQLECPEYRFISDRSPSGLAVPPMVKAANSIFVGDVMPTFSDLTDLGPVVVAGHVDLIAGNLVDFSCADGTTGYPGSSCVDLVADANGVAVINVEIKPNHCTNECETPGPLVTVTEWFKCRDEKLIVHVVGDNGPYLYHLEMNGQQLSTTDSIINIHHIVSLVDIGTMPYVLTVYDAAGNSTVFNGAVISTKRFYNPVTDSKIWMEYEPGSVHGDPGFYYAANLTCFSGRPAYITDSVYTTPPWYGATAMELIVWDRWGGIILRKSVNIDGSDDWSINNGEMFWNGKIGHDYGGNDEWGMCVPGAGNLYNYTLTNRNCFNIGSHLTFNRHIDEQASFMVANCLQVPWEVEETKSMEAKQDENDWEAQKINGQSRTMGELIRISENDFISCSPNPAKDKFELRSSDLEMKNLRVFDQTGKLVLSLGSVKSGEQVNIKSLSPGIYLLSITTDFGEKTLKIVKE